MLTFIAGLIIGGLAVHLKRDWDWFFHDEGVHRII